ncbi:DNA repair protein [Micromonospora sp. NPDC051006]|uniref:DNA repair protein n=1 Tax=Micromonospora sp. NPDC051006 TaxID=3364283 RepID=UPI0037AFD10C
MPIQPNDRFQQDTDRLWKASESAGRFPAQPPYRGARQAGEGQGWAELNKLPAGVSARHGLNSC